MQLEVGVNLAGYFDSALGLGQVARRLRAALESQGVPVAPVGLTADNAPRVDEPDRGLVSPGDARHPVNVICVNPDGLAGARDQLGPAFFQGRKTIGVWWWESGPVPERWLRAFDHVDELWAGSAHVAEALAAVAPVPVVRVPLPVTLPESDADRGRLGLPDGFLFLASFDYNSVLERKNPLGALRAFAASGAAERGGIRPPFLQQPGHLGRGSKLELAQHVADGLLSVGPLDPQCAADLRALRCVGPGTRNA